MHRRSMLLGLGAAIAAPAIVRAESLMKVVAVRSTPKFLVVGPFGTKFLTDNPMILPGHMTYVNPDSEELAQVFPINWGEGTRLSPRTIVGANWKYRAFPLLEANGVVSRLPRIERA